jgi:DNA-binding CsgD family transcriptional regulator
MPRKRKSSRKDPEQKRHYHSILSVPLQLADPNDLTTREKRSSHTQDTRFPAGGRRSTDKRFDGLQILWGTLSTREKDVAFLVCRGESDAEIAARLNLSYSTVKSYLQNVFFKMHVRNRKQLIVKFANFDFQHHLPLTGGLPDLF